MSLEAVISHCEGMKDRVAVLDFPAGITDLNTLTRPATASGATPSSSSASSSSGSASSELVGRANRMPKASRMPKARTAPPRRRRPRAAADRADRPGGRRLARDGLGGAVRPLHLDRRPDHRQARARAAVRPRRGRVGARRRQLAACTRRRRTRSIRGAVGLEYSLTSSEQGLLNSSGINAIRMINGGIRIWGARTRAGSASLWKYLPVRRLFAFAEESIQQGTNWVVFEPNDRTLWNLLRRDIDRVPAPALAATARCSARPNARRSSSSAIAETNPPENIDAGILTALVGMAPVKPAEFIVFKVSQYVAGSAGGEEA